MKNKCSRGEKYNSEKGTCENKKMNYSVYENKRTLLPNDLRDFLAIAGFLSALSLFWKFFLGKNFLINGDSLFFVLMGFGLLISGKVFNIGSWLYDGIQRNEVLFIFSLLFGLFSVISGFLIMFGVNLPANLSAIVGFVALFVALIIGIDYWRKNH